MDFTINCDSMKKTSTTSEILFNDLIKTNKIIVLLTLFIFFNLHLPVVAAKNINENDPVTAEALFDISLEELMGEKISVPAAITKLAPAETPAAITIITANDIRLTPARNIYDLLETYVPGAIWLNHEQGPHPGMRGNIVSRNYKFLLLVNGLVMNSKAHYGAKSELEQWDLSDIKKIEIIRGPGSVTYGPGAVAGVISITTHDANSSQGHKAEVAYINKYKSRGVNYSFGHTGADYQFYGFASTTRTDGYAADQFQGTNSSEAGYIGDDILPNAEPLDYFADYQDDPQYKLHAEINFAQHWSFWFRYTQQGSTWRGNEVKSDFNGELLNQQSVRDRQWTTAIKYEDKLSTSLDFSAMVSLDSFDAERRAENVRHPDPDHVLNFGSNYSEDELFARGVFNWQFSDETELALGAEFSYDRFGPGWGDDEKDMLLGDDGDIVNGPDSNAIGASGLDPADAIYAGDGWSTKTYSLFGEANMSLSPANKVLLSARLDKNTHSDYLFSPRAALIRKLNTNHVVKIVAQQSKRMNTAGQNYIENKNNNDPEEESLTSLEFAYTGLLNNRTQLNVSNFWNQADVIAWNNDVDRSIFIGELKLVGLEAELFYKWRGGNLGVNYSYVKQLDWNLDNDLEGSGISYGDYNQPLRNSNAVMESVGNDLNNWPNQALKLFARININAQTTWHVDAHVFWDYQGSKDGLKSLHDSVQGEPEEAAVEQAIANIEAVDTFDYDFRLNTSISYKPTSSLDIRFLVQNLLGSNRNKRYAYDSGTTRAAPHKVRFVEEPRTFGIKAEYKF